jgi:PHD/YefM family antitoxin component YafN of YafNO toxin-antitoxin module
LSRNHSAIDSGFAIFTDVFCGRHNMRQFSYSDFLRGMKTVTMAADSQPVIITQRHQPRYVLMTFDEYQAMTKTRANSRRVIGPGETPAELAEMILPELDSLIDAGA